TQRYVHSLSSRVNPSRRVPVVQERADGGKNGHVRHDDRSFEILLQRVGNILLSPFYAYYTMHYILRQP
ncbi:MAG: hypothetical protein ACN6OP_25195, partial [Pseudomonadales bacterium]